MGGAIPTYTSGRPPKTTVGILGIANSFASWPVSSGTEKTIEQSHIPIVARRGII
jgi:hypothetical protein